MLSLICINTATSKHRLYYVQKLIHIYVYNVHIYNIYKTFCKKNHSYLKHPTLPRFSPLNLSLSLSFFLSLAFSLALRLSLSRIHFLLAPVYSPRVGNNYPCLIIKLIIKQKVCIAIDILQDSLHLSLLSNADPFRE